ncbi:glycoside hydrolase domain-containing protein [Algibacter sp. L4_22]|uniref:glycoside hydrolase domain-containing protein n=1 Tax=Algibacter sp. L4_22 TaxID=2942477 RepID=UPI00201B905F|nr:glycoside hydrolase domain-containing protein [Algibacter sp. L4_22]MCL5129272.1 glycoside hydrolase family 92 protein [Algibacter sp. L4_22]
MKKYNFIIFSIFLLTFKCCLAQVKQNKKPVELVNVFLGTSGDHGQMSPSASSPFNMMSMGPQTTPHIHAGYEYYAKEFLGFTTTRIEGVGCVGSGGNILISPFIEETKKTNLIKEKENAQPGFYSVTFKNGIKAQMSVKHNFGIQSYHFPKIQSGLKIDLSFAFDDRFIAEENTLTDNIITGWIDTKTTCSKGIYRIYYALKVENIKSLKKTEDHIFIAERKNLDADMQVHLGFSSVNTKYAKDKLESISIEELKKETETEWLKLLSTIQVTGKKERTSLFYSLLYRGLQAPYLISENDGSYRAIDGSIQKTDHNIYNGWAIWDNYREQLPMLSLFYSNEFADISKSIANLYLYGKNDWATQHEPSPTVRTEHASVVLLDAYNKGYKLDLKTIKDSLIAEANKLVYNSPDKALESSYDNWAVSKLMKIIGDSTLSKKYKAKSLEYKTIWKKDFADLSKTDVDIMQARGLYQGTILQYRWFVPFDVKGLIELTGGENEYINQLDDFFDTYSYNHANQPDLQVPGMYNASKQPWKSQKLYRNIMLDTVVQNYFNNNSKGVDPFIGRIYNNKPKAYLRTMDDDSGTMSSWFVMRSIGFSPANVGSPVYYLTAPIFKSVSINFPNNKVLNINVKNYDKDHFYVKSVIFNGKNIDRNWLTHKELLDGGLLEIETSSKPNLKWGTKQPWISSLE